MKYVLALLVFIAQAPWASAEDLFLKVLKANVLDDQVATIISSLNTRQPISGSGFFQARVVSYQESLPELAHHGIVQIQLEDNGNPSAKTAYLQWIQGQIDSGIFMPFDNYRSDLCEARF